MKSTGRYSEDEELDRNPEKPFLKDIRKDLDVINIHFRSDIAKQIKKDMINEILKNV